MSEADLPFIPISAPILGDAVEASVLEVLRSGQLAQGPKVARLELLASQMAQTRNAVAVSNGTVALEAALQVANVGVGDEVITSPFTFAATLNAILRSGATARMVDIGKDFNVIPKAVAAAVNERTRAILPVDLFGLMADMESIAEIARLNGLTIIEDAAQAHGATQNSRAAGSFGLGTFSLYATKNIASGEGGLITTDDDDVADRLRVLRNQGMRQRYDYAIVGRNLRMSDLTAAVAIPQIERIDEIVARRQANAEALNERLRNTNLTLPVVPEGRVHVWHQYTVLLPQDTDRDRVVAELTNRRIGSGVYYPRLVWDHQPYRDRPSVIPGSTPNAADAAARCLSLPVHPGLDESDIDRIAEAMRHVIT
jgi:perosamine synthetase